MRLRRQRARPVPIRPLDLHTSDAVFDFLDAIVSRRGRTHWEWKYGGQHQKAPCGFYWEESDGRVLGFIGLMHTDLHAAGKRHPAAWFVDWHVVPGERGIGVGLGLLRKAEAATGALLTLQGSADTQSILPRLGWKRSFSPETWTLPVTARFLSAGIAERMPTWLRPFAPAAGVAARYFRGAQPSPRADFALVDIQRFPLSYDAVWEARAAEFASIMRRDPTYLNYLCADYPDGGYHLQLLQRRGQTLGHLISRVDGDRRGFRRGRIVDLLWPPADRALGAWALRSACWQLQLAGADYIDLVASTPLSGELARDARFRRRTPVPIWYHRLVAGSPSPDTWHITFLDCDRAYR